MASVTLISMFTDDILYQILYFLSLRQRIQASIICKRWRNIIASFDDNKLVQMNCGYCKQNPCIRSYNNCYGGDYLIKLASDNNTAFTEFYLLATCSLVSFPWNLVISESRLLLTVLYLKDCRISANNIGDSKELPVLKEIYFHATRMEDSTIFSEFIQKCPSLVELTLNNCYCRNFSLLVPNLLQLKKVHIVNEDGWKEIKEIEIKAQNLQEFRLRSSSLSRSSLDLRACTELQVLNVDCECIPFGFPTEIASAFPCLKSLFLRSYIEYKEFKILIPKLENSNLNDVTIDSPKVQFKLKLLSNGSRLKKVEMKQILTIDRLHKLRNFAENLGENIILSLVVDPKEEKSDRHNPRSDLQPLCIKHLNLKTTGLGATFNNFESRRPKYVPFVDMLFSYFHPQALVVYREVPYRSRGSKFAQVLSGKLKSRKRGCSKSHQCSNYMCWHHLLKDYKILENSTTRGDNGKSTHKISLVLEWSTAS